MLVELDVFSGRPNPRWELDETSADELRRLVDRLPPATGPPPEPPGLGYRGFVLGEGGRVLRVYRGHVSTPDALVADPSRTIERYLLGRIPQEWGDIAQRVTRELEL
jgi:hypothetical protein